jgi:hypothetical protein
MAASRLDRDRFRRLYIKLYHYPFSRDFLFELENRTIVRLSRLFAMPALG